MSSQDRGHSAQAHLAGTGWLGVLVTLSVAFAAIGHAQNPCEDDPCPDCTNACNPCNPPAAYDCCCSPHVARVPGVVSPTGGWSQSWNWSMYMYIEPATQNPEISHAALLTTGPYSGRVLLWRHAHVEFEGPPTSTPPTETLLWDPVNPSVLARVEQRPTANTFCSAHTFDERGQLLVLGGGPPEDPPAEVYRFDPQLLQYPPTASSDPHNLAQIIEGDPWTSLAELVLGRFYPTVITILGRTIHADPNPDVPGGAAIVLGGKHAEEHYPDPDSDPTTPNLYASGTHLIEFRLPPAEGSGPAHVLAASGATDVLIPSGITPEFYVPKPLPPETPAEPMLDYYPRAFHLADVVVNQVAEEQNIFVAHDVIPAAFHTDSLRPSNEEGYSWVFKPRYETADPWEVFSGPLELADDGNAWERVYGGAVLFHTNSNKNRILQFGGTYAPGSPPLDSRRHWRVVSEYYIPPGQPPELGQWRAKDHCMQTGRAFHNSVILPTGHVLLIGGSWGTSGSRERPEVCPELYDPGLPEPLDDTSTSWRMCARPSPNGTGYPYTRLYHSVAVLLLDGSVLNAGGEDLDTPPPAPPSPFPNGNFSGEVIGSSGVRVG